MHFGKGIQFALALIHAYIYSPNTHSVVENPTTALSAPNLTVHLKRIWEGKYKYQFLHI